MSQALAEQEDVLDALALRDAMRPPTRRARPMARGRRQARRRALPERDARRRRHPSHRGTTHISVIDPDGNAASASPSNGEGNGYIVGRFGFMLNNMLGEEDLSLDGLGQWREDARLSSMMAPTIILQPDGT